MKTANALSIGLLAALGLSSHALAQNTLEEVVVTATKRSTSLQDLAGGANVIGGEDLRPGGIENIRDMVTAVPNLSIGDQFGFARIFMRGIGMNSIDIGGEGAVSFLQDGAIIPRPSAQLVGMFDLEQVEVLRGPQGTLYGRGATAGAINLVTNKPGEELGGYLTATAGNYGLGTFEGAVDLPLGDAFSARLATKIEQRDGYGENLFTGTDVDDREAQAYRATLAYDAGGPWNASLSMQYTDEDDHNFAFHYFGPSQGTAGGLPLAVPVFGGRTVFDVDGDFYDINSDLEAINQRETLNSTLIINADLGERTTLRSVTSLQELDRFLRDDLDSTDADLFGRNDYTEESDSFSQEFTLNIEGDRLDILAGAMYFEEELFGQVLVPLNNVCALLAPETCGTPVGDGLNSGRFEQNGTVDIEAAALFIEANYALTDQLTLIAGARYNYEQRDGTGSFVFSAIGVDNATDQTESWDDITPRVTLEYRPNNDMMLYLTFNQAFKSGVINTGSLNPPLDPETVDAFEAGLKGTSKDGTLRYSLAAFHYSYEDLQISFVDADSTVATVNAAEAENYGVELELDAALGDRFSVDVFATYLSAEYEEFFNGDYANGFAITDLSGNTLPNAPEYTAKVGLNYETALGEGLLRLRGEVYYQDEIFFTEWNRDDAFQDSYTLLNASMDYALPGGNWLLSLWGRNLGDEEIISNNIITAPLYNSLRVGSMMPPRTYGGTASLNV